MAKPDSATSPLAELQDILRDGRKRQLNFALLKAKDGVVLKAHPNKSADVMFREAKGAGGMPAVSCTGTLTVSGKVMLLAASTEDVPRNLPKQARKHFQSLGLQCKVKISLPGGAELDDEDEAEGGPPADATNGPGDAGADPAPEITVDISAFEARLVDLLDRLAALTGPQVAPLRGRIDAARQALQTGDTADIEARIDKIADDITALHDQQTAERAALARAFAALSGDHDRLRERGTPPAVKKADQLAAMFQSELPRDLKKAGAVLTLLTSFLKAELARLPPEDTGKASVEVSAESSAEGDISATGPAPEDLACFPDGPPESAETCLQEIGAEFGSFWDQVCEMPDRSDAARMAEYGMIEQQRQVIASFFAAGPPAPDKWADLLTNMARLSNLVTTARQIAKVAETNPEAATRMREAMTGFDAELGVGTAVTPELLAQLDTEAAQAETDRVTAQAALDAAKALPAGPARDKAVSDAEAALGTATQALDAANRKRTAAQGKKGLTVAMTSGPLAPDAARPLSDGDAAQFVDAFRRQPALAEHGLEVAASSPHPGAVAEGMGMVCDRMETGFAAADGSAFPDGYDTAGYARNLLAGAGAEGGDFVAEAGAYIDKGQHLVPGPIPSPNGPSANGRERDRSNFLAGAVVGPDGAIDVESDAARNALGHLRFSPDVISSPTPSLNKHALKTFDMLSDPVNQQAAQDIMDDVDTPVGTGQMLLGRAMGKAVGTVTQGDARQQVMAAMMTPVHQGPVGSCFSTAGVRRMNETDPLESMRRYAELAETGVFTPRNDEDPIPAVMTFPADENPLIRSMEYSAATVMAGMERNSRSQLMNSAMTNAVDGLVGPVGDHPAWLSAMGTDNWKIDQTLIRQTLLSSFTVTYDANRSTAPSADGSSSKGVYILMQTQPISKAIASEADFVTALTERVLTAISEPAGSDKANEITTMIASRSYLDTLMQNGSAPWNMGGGGLPDEADDVLFGEGHSRKDLTTRRDGWDNLLGQTEGGRSAELLEAMLQSSQGSGAEMIPVMNLGIHAFNMLPNHPSMTALREGGDISGNIETQLVEPGKTIAATVLPDAKAAEITRELHLTLKKWDGSAPRQALVTTALGSGPGATGLTPKALQDRLRASLAPYLNKLSLDLADSWRRGELAAGRACTEADRDAQQVKNLKIYGDAVDGMILSATMKEVRVPSVTIADANWGDATHDVMFVMAPDPMTGELVLWSQFIPSGEMTPVGTKWVDTGWQEVIQ